MAKQNFNIQKLDTGLGKVLLDPTRLQQQTKYKTNGLTVTSNNTNIMPRDEAGNVIFHESSSQNPLLIIEPVDTKIMLKSVLKVLDTRFEYFKFPVSTTAVLDEEVEIDLEVETAEIDNVYARYRPSEPTRILSSTATKDAEKFSGIVMDFVEDGVLQKSTNQYFITKEIKSSGIDLRFRIKIEHRFDSVTAGYGTAYFSIIKNSPELGLSRLFKGPFANNSISSPTYFGSIFQYEVQTLNLDLIIKNEEFEIGDYFQIGATAGQNIDTEYHTINPIQSYWVITDASKNVDEWNQEIS